MKRALVAAVAIAVTPIAAAVPASAAPGTHDVHVENHDESEQFAAGDAEPCVPWGGTFTRCGRARSSSSRSTAVTSGTRHE